MTFQDLLYINSFANIEWQISKEIYLELQKHFYKDIFEEIIKYCYDTYDHLTTDNIPDNIGSKLLLIEIDQNKLILVVRCRNSIIEDNNFYGITGDILFSLYEDNDSFCSICLSDSKITLHLLVGPYRVPTSYKRIIIYTYHEINEIRTDKKKVKKLIEQGIFKDKKRLLSYCVGNN